MLTYFRYAGAAYALDQSTFTVFRMIDDRMLEESNLEICARVVLYGQKISEDIARGHLKAAPTSARQHCPADC